MNDIEKVEGRLFKNYSIVAYGGELTPGQIQHFLELKHYPSFKENSTIEEFEEALFGPGAKVFYVFEEFADVCGQDRLRAYQFSPVYSKRITLTGKYWKKRLRKEKILGVKKLKSNDANHANVFLDTIENHKKEIRDFYATGYSLGQTRGLLTGVREAVDFMQEHSKSNSSTKYGPGLIEDVEKWLIAAEAGTSGAPVDIETLIIHMVEKFTERRIQAERLKSSDAAVSGSLAK